MEKTHYEKFASINVNEHIEKKNGLSYLSWAWAVDQLLRMEPNANWTYGEPKQWGSTWMVFCTVTAFGKSMTAQLPVMDYKNKAIPNPDSFAVNTAMQRCLAKAIALHGLGLYIYAGEDLPLDEQVESNDLKILPASDYDAKKEGWKKSIETGKRTVTQLAEYLEKQGMRMSEEQFEEVCSWIPK